MRELKDFTWVKLQSNYLFKVCPKLLRHTYTSIFIYLHTMSLNADKRIKLPVTMACNMLPKFQNGKTTHSKMADINLLYIRILEEFLKQF